jgi:anti-sigma regulatory factor (Ser/Thr protein kinase)
MTRGGTPSDEDEAASIVERWFDPTPTAPGRARRFVGEVVARRASPGAANLEGLALLVSELVTNAVVHAGTPILVSVSVQAGQVHVGVGDAAPERPALRQPLGADGQESGYGMWLLQELTDAWGVDGGRGRGKLVWFQLPLAGTESIETSRRPVALAAG